MARCCKYASTYEVKLFINNKIKIYTVTKRIAIESNILMKINVSPYAL